LSGRTGRAGDSAPSFFSVFGLSFASFASFAAQDFSSDAVLLRRNTGKAKGRFDATSVPFTVYFLSSFFPVATSKSARFRK
jgi:hypothetical protein